MQRIHSTATKKETRVFPDFLVSEIVKPSGGGAIPSDAECSTIKRAAAERSRCRRRLSRVGRTSPRSYGGSRNTRSKVWFVLTRQFKFRAISHRMTDAWLSSRHSRIFREISATASRLRSTKTVLWAPLLRASMPSAPVPAKRSSTTASLTLLERILKTVSRSRSEVGLTVVALTGLNFFPRSCPPIMRKSRSLASRGRVAACFCYGNCLIFL